MWFKEMLNSTRDAEFDVCALYYHISFERLVPSFQYTTASGWQYTTSVSTMRSSSRGAERKRKRKRGDLKWRQGISIGQHSYYVASGTFVAVRCVRQAAVHSNFCKSYMCRDCNGQIRDASLYLWSWLMMMMMMMMISVRIAQALKHNGILKSCYDTGRSKRLYLTNDDDDDDSEDLCVAEVSGCATTHDNARNKHCR